jgi:hypothetical protein
MRVYFAGAEAEKFTLMLLDSGVRSILYSYHYILEYRREAFLSRMMLQHPDVSFFLDSGAYTFGMKARKGESHISWEKYNDRFMRYVAEFGHQYDRIAELDLDWSGLPVTPQMVDEWREEMMDESPSLPILPVWNRGRGDPAWDRYVRDERLKHLGIASGAGSLGSLAVKANQANAAGKTVHGFAMTKMSIFNYVRFDSCDSSSWIFGQKYGTLFVWRGDKMIMLTSAQKRDRRLYAKYFETIGCDPKKVIEDDVAEVRKCNIMSWKFLADRVEEQGRQRDIQSRELEEGRASRLEERDGVVSRLFRQREGAQVDAPQERPDGYEPKWWKQQRER